MKEEIFNLNKENKSLVQKPEMKEPPLAIYITGSKKQHDALYKRIEYNKHIASLKTYPISGIVPESWETGRDIPRSEFELKIFCKTDSQKCDSIICNTSCAYYVAVPIVQPTEQPVSKPMIEIDEVLSILNENYQACKNLTDEDKIRSAQETVNETYEDLIYIFNHKRNIYGTL